MRIEQVLTSEQSVTSLYKLSNLLQFYKATIGWVCLVGFINGFSRIEDFSLVSKLCVLAFKEYFKENNGFIFLCIQ